MAESRTELRELTDDELIEKYDQTARNTQVGLRHWADELNRRSQKRQTDSMLRLTRSINRMTVVITVATVMNVTIALGMLVAMTQT